jgi:hypothetical protein
MITERRIHNRTLSLYWIMLFCITFHSTVYAQKFSVSFPIGSTVYQESEILLTVLVENNSCSDMIVKCHQGKISYIEQCKYLYRCKNVGLDTIEVFIQKGKEIKRIGQQIFVVKERPHPEATVAGLKGGKIVKGFLKAQQGVGGEFFVGGNHWERCPVESFHFIVLRNNKVVLDLYNTSALFTTDVKAAMDIVEQGDKILFTNIKGCADHGNGI